MSYFVSVFSIHSHSSAPPPPPTPTHSHTESCSIMLACRAHECHVLFKQYALSGWSGTKLLTYLQFHLNTAHPYTTNVGARHKQFLHTTVGQPSTSLIDICLSLCFFLNIFIYSFSLFQSLCSSFSHWFNGTTLRKTCFVQQAIE